MDDIDIDNSLVGQLTSVRGIVEESLDTMVEHLWRSRFVISLFRLLS